MSQPVFTSPMKVKAVDLLQLARIIEERFMPLAFTCTCGGNDPSCRRALDDPKVWERRDAVEAIAKYIRSQA
jgi:hypothetical protein